jgi:acetyltransferase
LGLGGRLMELCEYQAIGLPPLNTTLARRLIEQTRIPLLLRPEIVSELETMLVRFSRFVVEFPMLREVEMNPVLLSSAGIDVQDARVVLFEAEALLPRPAIRPYPSQYAGDWGSYVIRPIRPEDELAIAAFHETLSETTVYRRFFSGLSLSHRVAHDRLTRVCFIDYDREMALVAEREGAIAAVSRFIRNPHGSGAEFALIVSDAHQRQGLGAEMLTRLIDIARKEGLEKLNGYVLSENIEMQNLCRKLGFELRYDAEEQMTIAERTL